MRRAHAALILVATSLLFTRVFIGYPVRVGTTGMAPGIWPGAVMWVWARAGVQVGDCVLWRPVRGEDPLVKRIVGLGGDHVEVIDGRLLRNGLPAATGETREVRVPVGGGRTATRTAVIEGDGWAVLPGGVAANEQVGEGQIFVLGDNRGVSEDSRQWGPGPLDAVLGVIGPVLWMPISE